MTDRIALYLLGAVAIIAFAVVVIADPPEPQKWIPVVTAILVALPGSFAVFQNRTQATKLEEVRKDVNSNAKRELDAKALEEHARGRLEAIEDFEPIIDAAVARALAAATAERENTGDTP